MTSTAGWAPTAGSGGADGLLRRWERSEGYRPDGAFLVISSGDMWTGPAISTVLEGKSMVDVMNALGYRAATLGNHDFDFGQDVIRQRRQEANFPFLGANIRVRSTGDLPDYLEPYTLIDVNAIRVGILGVTTVETPVDTRPANVEDLEFRPYAEALEKYVPEIRAAGADLIIVAGHMCGTELEALADTAAALGVAVIAGGHCHARINEVLDGVRLIESESFLQGYTRPRRVGRHGAGSRRRDAGRVQTQPGRHRRSGHGNAYCRLGAAAARRHAGAHRLRWRRTSTGPRRRCAACWCRPGWRPTRPPTWRWPACAMCSRISCPERCRRPQSSACCRRATLWCGSSSPESSWCRC